MFCGTGNPINEPQAALGIFYFASMYTLYMISFTIRYFQNGCQNFETPIELLQSSVKLY